MRGCSGLRHAQRLPRGLGETKLDTSTGARAAYGRRVQGLVAYMQESRCNMSHHAAIPVNWFP